MNKLFEEMDAKDFEKLLDSVPKNDLVNLVKSAGIKVNGLESEDELRGMYKAISAVDESINRRLYKLNIVNEGYVKNTEELENYTYHHDALDSDLVPDIMNEEDSNEVEIVIESIPRPSRSRFLK